MERIDQSICMARIAALVAVGMVLFAIVDGQMMWAKIFCAETALGAFVNMHYMSKKEKMRAETPE